MSRVDDQIAAALQRQPRFGVRPAPGDAVRAAAAATERKNTARAAEAKRAFTVGAPAAGRAVADWVAKPGSFTEAGKALYGAAKRGAKAVPGAVRAAPGVIRDAAAYAIAHPADAARETIDTASYMLPVVGSARTFTDAIDAATEARLAGDNETADLMSMLAVPMAGVNLATDGTGALALRGLKGAGRLAAKRPAYDIAQDGAFRTVARKGVEPTLIPEAANAGPAQLRAIAQDRTRSPLIRIADEAAMAARGVPYDEAAPKPVSSLQRQGAMGRAYREAASDNPAYKHALFERYGETMPEVVGKAQNYDQLRENAYGALGDEVAQQFDRMPLRTRYHGGEGEYPSSTAMAQDVLANGQINVFSGGEPHEFLSKVDPATGLSQNEMFRAVHDAYGHVVPGSMFGPKGEEVAYAAHSQMLSPLAQLALLSETRGQNSLVNYSPLNAKLIAEKNRLRLLSEEGRLARDYVANYRGNTDDIRKLMQDLPDPEEILRRQRELGEQFQYAPQKAVLLPPEFLDPMAPGGTPDWLRPILSGKSDVSARGVHWSREPDLQVTDPSFYGRGHQGDDYGMSRANGLPDRTHFYSGAEGTVGAENEVTRRAKGVFEGNLSNLYDLNTDPEGLVGLAQAVNKTGYKPVLPYYLSSKLDTGGSAIPDFERLVRDYGYGGYLADFGPGRRAASVYDPVPVRKIGEDVRARYAEGGRVSPNG